MRAESGLALSSRNTRLSEKGVADAFALSKALKAIASSSNKSAELCETALLNDNTAVELEYLKGLTRLLLRTETKRKTGLHCYCRRS